MGGQPMYQPPDLSQDDRPSSADRVRLSSTSTKVDLHSSVVWYAKKKWISSYHDDADQEVSSGLPEPGTAGRHVATLKLVPARAGWFRESTGEPALSDAPSSSPVADYQSVGVNEPPSEHGMTRQATSITFQRWEVELAPGCCERLVEETAKDFERRLDTQQAGICSNKCCAPLLACCLASLHTVFFIFSDMLSALSGLFTTTYNRYSIQSTAENLVQ